ALAATEKLAAAGTIKRDDRVVVISTANALNFTEFKVRYHEQTLDEVTSDMANPPVELPADLGRVEHEIDALGTVTS
ncbi:MAG: threonine synthase, partial [Polyangiaceae bacterium]